MSATRSRPPGPTSTLSPTGLDRLHGAMSAHVGAGRLSGLITLVACGGEVHIDTIGRPSFVDDARLQRDALIRIASLTKPITAVATLSLVEQGLLALEQPIDELIPELADRRVLRSVDAELDDTVAAKRAITLEDLLSFRCGFGSVMAPPDSHPIQRAEAELGLRSISGPPWPPVAHDVDGWIRALGSLPLIAQPGEQWLYNTSAQVLGVLLARACGRDLESVLRERVFAPLGMVDTAFTVPAEKLGRLPTAYRPDPQTGELSVLDDPADSWWSRPPSFPDASGWLVSTIDDYWSFVSMILAGGTGRGERILTPATVALMTTDRLTPAQRSAARLFLGDHGSERLKAAVADRRVGVSDERCQVGSRPAVELERVANALLDPLDFRRRARRAARARSEPPDDPPAQPDGLPTDCPAASPAGEARREAHRRTRAARRESELDIVRGGRADRRRIDPPSGEDVYRPRDPNRHAGLPFEAGQHAPYGREDVQADA